MRYTRLLLFCSLVFSMSSCLGPKKINKWVDSHYEGTQPPRPAKANESITISTPLTAPDEKLSRTETTTHKMLPLLFYWRFDYQHSCTLNPGIAINNFTMTALAYAGKKGLKQKLHGQRLLLSVDQVPHAFAIGDKGYLVWVILAKFGKETLTIQPELTDLVVSYRLLQPDGTEIKKGTISIPDTDKGIYLTIFQSVKNKTKQYLDQYDAQVTTMSKEVIDRLLTEL